MAIYAHKVSTSKKYKTVSYIFTNKKVKSAKKTKEHGLEFEESNFSADIAFGSLPCKVDGVRVMKADKALIAKCKKNFKQGLKFKNLKFAETPDKEGFFKVEVVK